MSFIENPEVSNVKRGVIETLNSYKEFGNKFENPPKVKLVIKPQVVGDVNGEIGARDIAITTAVQCYAPGDAVLKPRPEDKMQGIANSTAEAGHHTTRMHAHYTFHIEVTRDLAERILHSHPFYNSEQQSQRYVEAKRGNYEVPTGLTVEQRELYIDCAEYMNQKYFEFLKELEPVVGLRIQDMYPKAGWKVEKTANRLNSKINKICQEIARYVLPIAQKTKMYHTLNEIQILRLFRASQFENFSDESRFVIASMIEQIAEVDPSILQELEKPIEPRKQPSFNSNLVSSKESFDTLLDGGEAKLLGGTEKPREVLAHAVRNILGRDDLSDLQALDKLMDPKVNQLLGDVYETGMFDPFTSCLRQVSFTFATKLSHTAESQRQRHRRNPGATPPVDQTYDGKPDYITPFVVKQHNYLRSFYEDAMHNIYKKINSCIEAGIPRDVALKLLPNGHAIRTIESGDLFDWLHRFKQRLCYLAQEEIFFISLDEAEQILELIPEADDMLQAPCGVAYIAGTGKCPEGDRWCGKPVWKDKISEYRKGRLI